MAAAAAAAAAAATAATSEGPASRGVLGSYPSPARSSAIVPGKGVGGTGGMVPASGVAGVLPFGSPGGGGAGSSGRGPKGVGSWTKEEDDRLNALVGMFGVKWSQVRLV